MRNPFNWKSCAGSYAANIAARQNAQREMYSNKLTPSQEEEQKREAEREAEHREYERMGENTIRMAREEADYARQNGDMDEARRMDLKAKIRGGGASFWEVREYGKLCRKKR